MAEIILECNLAWAKARKTDSPTDWLAFRLLRNTCSSLIKKAKSEYYLSVTTENLNDPRKFWKVINSLSMSKCPQTLPSYVLNDSVPVYDKKELMNCFNNHFVSSCFVYDSVGSFSDRPSADPPIYNFVPFSVLEVHKALKNIDPRKSLGPDMIDPYFLKTAADFVAEPLTFLFNLTVETNEIPSAWKSAFVLPVFKGGDPAMLTNYRPINISSVLAKVLEALGQVVFRF